MISIHAPRGGSDRTASHTRRPLSDFNPRSPWGERRAWAVISASAFTFQSTLPVGGATFSPSSCTRALSISIHAPRGGSDPCWPHRSPPATHFNPRSPWGERLVPLHIPGALFQFQSTLPVGGATQSTQPVASQYAQFQSTLPVGGATVHALGYTLDDLISIHAPRGGSDDAPQVVPFNRKVFQSTLPVGGATWYVADALAPYLISIHAPRGGSDVNQVVQQSATQISIHAPRGGSDYSRMWADRCMMISIHAPRGGSDMEETIRQLMNQDFNPRSPWGERP